METAYWVYLKKTEEDYVDINTLTGLYYALIYPFWYMA